MLALREYFWVNSDWVTSGGSTSSDAATSITFGGPNAGLVNVASSNFSVGANGSISAVLVVTIANAGGTGVFSQSVFSLSTGAATGTFTYTPSTLGTHNITETNNQGLANGSLIPYAVTAVVVPSTTPSGGGGGHSNYHPLHDDFWEARERHLKSQPQSPRKSVDYVEPAVPPPISIKPAVPGESQVTSQILKLFIAETEGKPQAKVVKAKAQLTSLLAQRDALLANPNHTRIPVMQLNLDISKILSQYDVEAALNLLLDAS